MRCDVHDIAAGPDGRCALCREAARADAKRSGAKLGLALILGLGSASALLLAYGAWRRAQTESPTSALRVTPEPAVAAATPAIAAPPIASESPPPALAEAPSPPTLPTPTAGAETPAPSAATIASGDNRAPAPLAAARPSPRQIEAAVASTPIVMFTAPWCAVCRRAHAFLQANGLRCVDRDIDSDPAARRELKTRTGETSIPTFDIDGQLLEPGFSEESVERAVTQSVERRLGATGLSIQRGKSR